MPKSKKKQSFLQGAAILVVSTVIVKAIGALFKIPLNNLLDGVGMAYFSSAYTIFNTLYALAVAGLPIAVAKLVSENVVLGRYRQVKQILRISRILFIVTGSIGFLIMLFGARPFAELVKNPGAFLAILVMSPAVIFCCLMASYRGYYQGLSNMYPTAVSQVVEALAKLVFGTGLAWYTTQYLGQEYSLSGTVFGMQMSDTAQAGVVISQYAAAGAIAGIVISTFFGAVYCWARYTFGGDGITKEQIENSPPPKSAKRLIPQMIKIAIPVCLGAVALNLTALIDMASIMTCLEKAIQTDYSAVAGMYAGNLPTDLRQMDLPAYLYGSFSGIAVTLFNLVPALTSTFGISALPAVTAAWVGGNKAHIKRSIESVMRITSIVAFPAGLGIAMMAQPIAEFVFYKVPQEAAIGGELLQVLGIAAIFVALATPINSILQAMGRVDIPVKLLVLGGAVKLAANYMFIQIPTINIQAAPYGTLICYVIIITVSMIVLTRTIQSRLRWGSVFIKPLTAAVLCGITARVSYSFMSHISDSLVIIIPSIALGGIIYAISLILLRGVCKEDVLMLPMGEKIAKLLENRHLLG